MQSQRILVAGYVTIFRLFGHFFTQLVLILHLKRIIDTEVEHSFFDSEFLYPSVAHFLGRVICRYPHIKANYKEVEVVTQPKSGT